MSPIHAPAAAPPPAPDQARDPPAEPPPRATLLNIQALRAVAALMVVCVHLQALAVLGGAPPKATEAGNAGVDLFFVISGFIMVFTTGRKPQGPLTFLASRVRRVAPLYWSVTLAVFAIARFAPALIQNTPSDLRRLAESLLFIPALRPDGTMRPVVFVGWTLNFEMAFYALFALALLAPRRWVGVLGVVAVLALGVLWGQVARPESPTLAFYSTPMVLEFGLGMLLGLAWPRLRPPAGLVAPLAAAAATAFVLILAGPWLWPQADRLLAFGLPAAVIVAVALAIERRGRAARWPWLQALGAASYSVYLSHFFVTQAVILVVRRMGLQGPWAAFAAAAVAFCGVALTGLVLHRTLEQGMDRLLVSLRAPRGSDGAARAPGFSKIKPASRSV